MKTLYLHIGTPKTGTTSIQEFMVCNREALQQHGICYPDIQKKFANISPNRNGHFLVCRLWEGDQRNKTKEKETLEKGMQIIKEAFEKYDTVVLSDEHLWWATSSHRKGLWKYLKNQAASGKFQIKIICYLRRQDDYISSHWNQFVKNNVNHSGWEEHVERFLENGIERMDYAEKLESLIQTFGEGNVVIRRFVPKEFYGRSIYKDFMYALGAEWYEEYQLPEENDNNRALKGNTFELKRIINELPGINEQEVRQIGHLLKDFSELSGSEYKYRMFSEEERNAFMERFAEGNEKVEKEMIKDGKPLFPEEDSTLEKWDSQNPYMYRDLVRFIGMVYLELERRECELEKRVKQLETRGGIVKKVYHKIGRKLHK